MEKIIIYFGEKAKVNCDENCKKAYGINRRPRKYKELPGKVFGLNGTSIYPDEEINNYDDFEYLKDNELPDAPIDPGTYEGGHAKPVDPKNKPIKNLIPNKWCVRECERCNMSNPGECNLPLPIRSF